MRATLSAAPHILLNWHLIEKKEKNHENLNYIQATCEFSSIAFEAPASYKLYYSLGSKCPFDGKNNFELKLGSFFATRQLF